MDARQLAAFCAVVERKSFSQAAERLGVPSRRSASRFALARGPAGAEAPRPLGSPGRADRGGARGSTEARSVSSSRSDSCSRTSPAAEGPLRGQLALGASDLTGRHGRPGSPLRVRRGELRGRVDLSISDTQTIVDRVARRELALGVVGATPRNRSVAYEPFFRDEVVLVCPPKHRFAGNGHADDLRTGR